MGYQPTRDTPGAMPPFNYKKRSLITCEYCGMAYDGDRHDNCPHCLAPRPKAQENKPDEVCLYSDNRLYCKVDSDGVARPCAPEPYGTVGRC